MTFIIFFCLFVISVICLILGYRMSSFGHGQIHDVKQQCTLCGSTKEKVQLCQFERHHKTMVAPLCFDCSIKHDALPVRGASGDAVSATV